MLNIYRKHLRLLSSIKSTIALILTSHAVKKFSPVIIRLEEAVVKIGMRDLKLKKYLNGEAGSLVNNGYRKLPFS